MHKKLQSETGIAARFASSDRSNAEIAEELFLRTLGRLPSDAEREVLVSSLSRTDRERRLLVEDVLWMLLNHREFLFQH